VAHTSEPPIWTYQGTVCTPPYGSTKQPQPLRTHWGTPEAQMHRDMEQPLALGPKGRHEHSARPSRQTRNRARNAHAESLAWPHAWRNQHHGGLFTCGTPSTGRLKSPAGLAPHRAPQAAVTCLEHCSHGSARAASACTGGDNVTHPSDLACVISRLKSHPDHLHECLVSSCSVR
jgi:hypothetical protein